MSDAAAEEATTTLQDIAELLQQSARAELPPILSLHVLPFHTQPTDVRLQLASAADLAAWAQWHGTDVTLRDRRSYVEVSTDLHSGSTVVALWAALRHSDAHRIGLKLGHDDVTATGATTEPRLLSEAVVAAGC